MDEATRRLLGKFEKKFRERTVLFQEGDEGNELYYIIEGKVEAVRSTSGQVYVRSRMHEGDYFGEMSFLAGDKRTATVTCLTDCIFLVFPTNALQILIEKKSDIALEMMKGLADRLLKAEKNLERATLEKSCLYLAQYIYLYGSESGKKAFERVEIPLERVVVKVSDTMQIPLSIARKAVDKMAETGHLHIKNLHSRDYLVVDPGDKLYNQEDWIKLLTNL
jgi:CRP/FNR family transcriptional regulator, cyclic AMP receptor protein